MKSPIKLLKEKRAEISAEYKRVCEIYYGGVTASKNLIYYKNFEKDKIKDLERIFKELQQYDEAINSLESIKNCIF